MTAEATAAGHLEPRPSIELPVGLSRREFDFGLPRERAFSLVSPVTRDGVTTVWSGHHGCDDQPGPVASRLTMPPAGTAWHKAAVDRIGITPLRRQDWPGPVPRPPDRLDRR